MASSISPKSAVLYACAIFSCLTPSYSSHLDRRNQHGFPGPGSTPATPSGPQSAPPGTRMCSYHVYMTENSDKIDEFTTVATSYGLDVTLYDSNKNQLDYVDGHGNVEDIHHTWKNGNNDNNDPTFTTPVGGEAAKHCRDVKGLASQFCVEPPQPHYFYDEGISLYDPNQTFNWGITFSYQNYTWASPQDMTHCPRKDLDFGLSVGCVDNPWGKDYSDISMDGTFPCPS